MIKQTLDISKTRTDGELQAASNLLEIKLLLDSDSKDDAAIIAKAFPLSTNQNIMTMNGDKSERDRLAKMHNGDIYTKAQVKELCMKYCLQFLPAAKYKGNIPVDLIHEMKAKFTEENNLAYLKKASASDYARNIFIIAPASMFESETVGGIIKKEQIAATAAAEIRRLKAQDPAAFVRIDDDNFMYLKEWGKSFTFGRRILGAMTATPFAINTLSFLRMFLYAVVGLFLIKSMPNIQTIVGTEKELNMWAIPFVVAIVTYIIGFIFLSQNSPFLWIQDDRYATKNNWSGIGDDNWEKNPRYID